MKKLLLSVTALAVSGAVSAQLKGNGDGFTWNNNDASSQCLINSAPNNGGIMNSDGNTFTATASTNNLTTSGYVVLTSVANVPQNGVPTWFSLPRIVGSGATAQCSNLYGSGEYLDLSSGLGEVAIDFEADVSGATLEVFLGGPGEGAPITSTYNTGAGDAIITSCTVDQANVMQSVCLRFKDLDPSVWGAWGDRDKIQSIGFRAASDGSSGNVTFKISEVRFGGFSCYYGAEENSYNQVSVFPNPVTNGILNFTETLESIQVFDIVGNLVATANNTNIVDLTGVNSGVYFVQTSLGNAKVIVR